MGLQMSTWMAVSPKTKVSKAYGYRIMVRSLVYGPVTSRRLGAAWE